MHPNLSKLLFDRRDHALLQIVNDVLSRDRDRTRDRQKFYPYFHPHGIKEMAESRGLRIAHAVIHLLESLETGRPDDRLNALRSLRDEVLNAAAGSMSKNTARVLLQIMKELVRAHGDHRGQLELAHDFRSTATGKPRMVRRQLRRYHLLEMPEEWNQQTFDDHVHDINTKGRKSPTHLIMDAWIKGIRRLRVVYYNYIKPRFAAELLEAAAIMGITVRIGIEFAAEFRNRYVRFIWVPRGFPDANSFVEFLSGEAVRELMAQGKAVSEFQQSYVMRILQEYNLKHRITLNRCYDLNLAPIDDAEFLSYVGTGQTSILHLAKFIHKQMLPEMHKRVSILQECHSESEPEEQHRIEQMIQEMNDLDSEALVERFLHPANNPDIPDPNQVQPAVDTPDLLHLSPRKLLKQLSALHAGYRITLNLSGLGVEDVLELLYDCEGMISRLEIFNLKDHTAGKTTNLPEISDLQLAINEGNVIRLKRLIRHVIDLLEKSEQFDKADRIQKLTCILHDIATLKVLYSSNPLKSRIGSDSTGQSARTHGMGMAIMETLPFRAQRKIRHALDTPRMIIPVHIPVYRRKTYIPYQGSNRLLKALLRMIRYLPGLRLIGQQYREDWVTQESYTCMQTPGNIVTLGGIQRSTGNGFGLVEAQRSTKRHFISWKYLNSHLKNMLKIIIGFVPAFITFFTSRDWWLLAYFGAVIWFAITGLRNILQSVLGGGGIRRSPLLRWNEYVNWERLTDSLLYTGFSVPLLDYAVKTVILDRFFNITAATNPVALYASIALANGVYLSSHNVLRGLPKGAVYGNFFRSMLSIPLAILLNMIIGGVLSAAGVSSIHNHLQQWAAVISKGASDFVAGIIEGTADRYQNVQIRLRDYNNKLMQLFDAYAKLELIFPDTQVLEPLELLNKFKLVSTREALKFEKIIIINALDLMYFWMYQPRSRTALKTLLTTLSNEERRILSDSQNILMHQREIGQLFLDGIIGKNFSRGLSFYLQCSEGYLKTFQMLVNKIEPRQERHETRHQMVQA